MEINFTQEEYRLLLELVGLTEWMLEARSAGDVQEDRHEPLVQKLFSLAEAMGCGDCVSYSPRQGRHVPSGELHDNPRFRALIENYDFHNFWSGLADRLAARDAHRRYGERLAQMPSQDRLAAISRFEREWLSEFEKHGLERIGVLK